jgi:hypothetical protein
MMRQSMILPLLGVGALAGTTSQSPPSLATTPISFTVASAQLRGQPETAILTLCGNSTP